MFNLKAVNNNINRFGRSMSRSLKKHSPEVLTGLGLAGMVITVVLAVKATPEAEKEIEKVKKEEEKETLTKTETVKAVWKCYVPAAASGFVSVACIIGASSIHMKRNAALATAYGMTQTAFKEYKDKVVETVGEKKEQSIRDEVDKERIKKNPPKKEDIIITDKGDTLCYDPALERYFRSSADAIRKAEQYINRRLRDELYVSLGDFYDELGLKHGSVYEDVGWNVDWGWVDIRFSSQLTPDGTPCLVINYDIEPRSGYETLR